MYSSELSRPSILLRKGEIRRVPNGLGRRLEALSGSLWITIDNDRRDIVVQPGEGFSVDRSGKMLISAMADSRFVMLDPTD